MSQDDLATIEDTVYGNLPDYLLSDARPDNDGSNSTTTNKRNYDVFEQQLTSIRSRATPIGNLVPKSEWQKLCRPERQVVARRVMMPGHVY